MFAGSESNGDPLLNICCLFFERYEVASTLSFPALLLSLTFGCVCETGSETE